MHASAKICNQFIEMAFWYSFLITLGAVTLRKVFLKRITVCLLSRPYLAFNRFQSRTSEFIWTALASLNFLVRAIVHTIPPCDASSLYIPMSVNLSKLSSITSFARMLPTPCLRMAPVEKTVWGQNKRFYILFFEIKVMSSSRKG